ncbi:NACHT domain-containing NTPase [Arthrobacter sp. SDTb3-6]|uniref:NACHT domain-containing protein n=1 Tax=Arthrobacter sp. SDTb3-6 TaxID=2713571 RepID=UPI00159D12E8|nr:NACHT domain-containing protein [Arthrobacter sp. SDTb3-6]NVM98405.1 NACHT domain-containing protein [Arthrobacter sp. SDTb3-6]
MDRPGYNEGQRRWCTQPQLISGKPRQDPTRDMITPTTGELMARSKSRELVLALASVGIASLGGPLSIFRAVLNEAIKYGQNKHEGNEQTREVHKQVVRAISAWAASEHFDTEVIDRGLKLAAASIASFGLDAQALAAVNFDPKYAASKVVNAAKSKDESWGLEDHYYVAVRGIEVTYEALVEQYEIRQGMLLPAVRALWSGIESYAAQAEALIQENKLQLNTISEALVSTGTSSDVMTYLRTRIENWDTSSWHPENHSASALSRRLHVRVISKSATDGQALTAEDALENQQMLVVLGGPGSGKTWQARRYAREAAQIALSRLQEGASLSDVELPLLTTWDQWAKTGGPLRASLIAASFASGQGHADFGEAAIVDRLQRTFRDPLTRVLLVVDSLDEAADITGQSNRLRELEDLTEQWRVVITSRPAAWEATCRSDSVQVPSRKVVELCDLSYPKDVFSFIRNWFSTALDPTRGESLIDQIDAHADLVRASVVPLMLTFYCLLAERPSAEAPPLPTRRRDLYRKLVRQLLRGGWATIVPGVDGEPDHDYCEVLLRKWAWDAVRTRNTSGGLGDWGDTFVQPSSVRLADRRAIDNIAPKISVDFDGNITRRFVHRTFLEHFVAEYVASLKDAKEAALILLPHLWFDPDWLVSVPASITAHNETQKGVLLDLILNQALKPAPDTARQIARNEVDRLLLSLAEESEPNDWSPEQQVLIHECRIRCAPKAPKRIARSAHWSLSNGMACRAAIAAMSKLIDGADESDDFWAVADIAAVIPTLLQDADDRWDARTMVHAALSKEGLYGKPELLGVLPRLVRSPLERERARAAAMETLSHSTLWSPSGFAVALLSLVGGSEERMQTRGVILAEMRRENSQNIDVLTASLLALDPDDDDLKESRKIVLDALPGLDKWLVDNAASALLALTKDKVDRQHAFSSVLRAFTASSSSEDGYANRARILSKLAESDEERSIARIAVINAMHGTADWTIRKLVDELLTLKPGDDDRCQARESFIVSLTSSYRKQYSDPGDAAKSLSALIWNDDERTQACNALVDALSKSDASSFVELIRVLALLEPTKKDRARARTFVLTALPDADHGLLIQLLAALPILGLGNKQKAWARTFVLTALPDADPDLLIQLLLVLPKLDPSNEEKAKTRPAILDAALATNPSRQLKLLSNLPALDPSTDERKQARTILVAMLSNERSWYLNEFPSIFLPLVADEPDRHDATAALLTALPRAEPGTTEILIKVVAAIATKSVEIDWARTTILAALSGASPPAVYTLGNILGTLKPNDVEKSQARAAVVESLPSAKSNAVSQLVKMFTMLDPSENDRNQVRTQLLRCLPNSNVPTSREMTKALRSFSQLPLWLEWLAQED